MTGGAGHVLLGLGASLMWRHQAPNAILRQAINRLVEPDQARGCAWLVPGQGNGVSGFWSSRAWPDPSDPPFVNAVVRVSTRLDPHALLAWLHTIEDEFGRTRGAPNAPRTLDLDVLDYDGLVLNHDDLVLPHPRMHERAFVLKPVMDVAPLWRHPVLGKTAQQLLSGLPPHVQDDTWRFA